MKSDEDVVERLFAKYPEALGAVYHRGVQAGIEEVKRAGAKLIEDAKAVVAEGVLSERIRCASIVQLGEQHDAELSAVVAAIKDGIGASEFLERIGVEPPKADPSGMN